MKKMIRVLRKYENMSGQMIYLDKSLFYLHEKTPARVCSLARRITRIKRRKFPFTYLGVPSFMVERRNLILRILLRK